MTSRRIALSVLALALAGCPQGTKPPPPEPPPSILSFTVSKSQIAKGESVTFDFTTERANGVLLVDQAGIEIPTTFDKESGVGSATATPTTSSFYVLRAESELGRDSAFVQVSVDEGPKAVFLAVVPPEVKAGGDVTILWSAAGATGVTVNDGTTDVGTGETGTVVVTPAKTTTYTLSGTRPGGAPINVQGTVTVHPVVHSFSATPAAGMPGETLTLNWETGGADSIELSEATFGVLTTSSTDVATGSFAFEVPAYQADAGLADPDAGIRVPPTYAGMPLRFTLKATSTTPAETAAATVDGRVGSGPYIDDFAAPAWATVNTPVTLTWATTNATRVELWASGSRVYTTTAVDGSFTYPALAADTTFTLKAFDLTGLTASVTKTTKVAQPPTVDTFTASATVASVASPVSLTWTTTNASHVVLRVKNGPTLFTTDLANQVASGMTDVYLGGSTTLVLEAWSAADDMASKEASTTVTTETKIDITPNPVASGDTVTASWDVTAAAPVDLPGLMTTAPISTASPTSFIDLAQEPTAQVLFAPNADDDVVAYKAPGGFTFPFMDLQVNTFYVSTNGFVALTPISNASNALSTNPDLSSSSYSGPAALAPFWDDLDLRSGGQLLAQVRGSDFPRVLVLQWNKAKVYGQDPSEVTFQVQLLESGEFYFVYKTLQGTDGDGASASVGVVRAAGVFQVSSSYDTAGYLSEGQELRWFGGGTPALTGNFSFPVLQTTRVGFFAVTASGDYAPVRGTARAFSANSVLVNEAMPLPDTSLTAGQWIELRNPSATDELDLEGLTLESTTGTSAAAYTFPPGAVLPAGGYLVAGQSTDTGANGGAPVDYAWGSGEVPMTDTDGVTLSIPGTTPFAIDSLSWTPGADGGVVTGESFHFDVSVTGTSASNVKPAPLTCARSSTYGTLMQVGTPGAQNDSCFGYTLSTIPEAYVDISGTGTPVFAGPDMDSYYSSVPLAPAFTYFGAARSSMVVSSNGWIAFTPQTDWGTGNKDYPSASSDPVGAIAPFWDDLDEPTAWSGICNVFVARRADRTIVEWHHFEHWLYEDDLNFQVHLLDNGQIEFHFADMISGSSDNYADGNSATVWVEKPDGSSALAIGINQPVIRPHTAFRFTPTP